MARYSEEHRAAVVAKLLPPQSLSSQAVAEQEGLSLATVYIAVIYDLQTF